MIINGSFLGSAILLYFHMPCLHQRPEKMQIHYEQTKKKERNYMILISWMLFKNFFQSLYDYDIYYLNYLNFFLFKQWIEKKIFRSYLVLIYCVSHRLTVIFSCYNLFGDLHDIRKNIIIYDKDRRLLTALQSTINCCILVLNTCISINLKI